MALWNILYQTHFIAEINFNKCTAAIILFQTFAIKTTITQNSCEIICCVGYQVKDDAIYDVAKT